MGTCVAASSTVVTPEARYAGKCFRFSSRSAPGEWIVGRGWDQNDWQIERFPTRAILDSVAPDNPVVLTRIDGHAYWVNSRALRAAGISASTPDPQGGRLERAPGGEPTGVLIDLAMNLVDRVVPELTDADVEERLKLALDECARLGLTEVLALRPGPSLDIESELESRGVTGVAVTFLADEADVGLQAVANVPATPDTA